MPSGIQEAVADPFNRGQDLLERPSVKCSGIPAQLEPSGFGAKTFQLSMTSFAGLLDVSTGTKGWLRIQRARSPLYDTVVRLFLLAE